MNLKENINLIVIVLFYLKKNKILNLKIIYFLFLARSINKQSFSLSLNGIRNYQINLNDIYYEDNYLMNDSKFLILVIIYM